MKAYAILIVIIVLLNNCSSQNVWDDTLDFLNIKKDPDSIRNVVSCFHECFLAKCFIACMLVKTVNYDF